MAEDRTGTDRMARSDAAGALEQTIGYTFTERAFLEQALTHSSYANEHRNRQLGDNERLEFLGDAVLEVVSSDYLYHRYPDLPEGKLTRLRASLVCEPTLAYCARQISLPEYLRLGRGEEKTGGRGRDSIVSDALEALIGAIYLDGGQEQARNFIARFVLNDIEHKQLFQDSKTRLQEIVQARKDLSELSYETVEERGPEHDRLFVVHAVIGGRVMGRGSGRSKKSAEQEAAYHAILKLKDEGRS